MARTSCPRKPQTPLEERVRRVARKAAENFDFESNSERTLTKERAEQRFYNTTLSAEHPEVRERFVREALCWWRQL
jgi:hypothetical protein